MENNYFLNCNEDLNIKLSSYALYILKCDKSAFLDNKTQRSQFLNTIIANFWERSEAFLEPETNFKYSGDTPFRMHLKADFLDELDRRFSEKENSSKVDRVYKSYIYNKKFSSARFFAAILEEYARQSFVDREAVFYREQYDKIKHTISLNQGKVVQIIKITTIDNITIDICPVAIEKDEWSTYNYVIGFSIADNKLCPTSMRLSRIKDIDVRSSKNSPLAAVNKKHISELYQKINEYGVMYVSPYSKLITARIKFTKDGFDLYNKMSFLRPQFIELKEDEDKNGGCTMTFKCTEKQILDYFRKFGDYIKVLESDELRKKFANFYKDAARLYEDNTN